MPERSVWDEVGDVIEAFEALASKERISKKAPEWAKLVRAVEPLSSRHDRVQKLRDELRAAGAIDV